MPNGALEDPVDQCTACSYAIAAFLVLWCASACTRCGRLADSFELYAAAVALLMAGDLEIVHTCILHAMRKHIKTQTSFYAAMS